MSREEEWFSVAYPVEMIDGKVTKYRIKGINYILETVEDPNNPNLNATETVEKEESNALPTYILPKLEETRGGKETFFMKYLKKQRVGDIVLLEDFFELHPRQQVDKPSRKRIDRQISKLLAKNVLTQMSNTSFRLNKDVE